LIRAEASSCVRLTTTEEEPLLFYIRILVKRGDAPVEMTHSVLSLVFRVSKRCPRNCRSLGFPDFLSRVAASVNCMWFSLGRTT
jgi:hypothetical protein